MTRAVAARRRARHRARRRRRGGAGDERVPRSDGLRPRCRAVGGRSGDAPRAVPGRVPAQLHRRRARRRAQPPCDRRHVPRSARQPGQPRITTTTSAVFDGYYTGVPRRGDVASGRTSAAFPRPAEAAARPRDLAPPRSVSARASVDSARANGERLRRTHDAGRAGLRAERAPRRSLARGRALHADRAGRDRRDVRHRHADRAQRPRCGRRPGERGAARERAVVQVHALCAGAGR